MSRYILDQGRRNNPVGIAPHPYPTHQVGWPAQLLTPNASTFVRPGSPQFGQVTPPPATDNSKLIMGLLLIAAAIILWKVITPGAKRNPGGRNRVATVFKGAGGWYYKLGRKRARRRGPFSSECAAVEAAESRGYYVVED